MNTSRYADLQARAEQRRAQIVNAATACFLAHGFHGTSVAEIAKKAGISSGHLYHYFIDKEAIITAIIEEDLARLQAFTAQWQWQHHHYNLKMLLSQLIEGMRLRLACPTIYLRVEIMAEATRNPKVAKVVRQVDDICHQSIADAITYAWKAEKRVQPLPCCDTITELIVTFSEGLVMRSVCNPEHNTEQLISQYALAIGHLLHQELTGAAHSADR